MTWKTAGNILGPIVGGLVVAVSTYHMQTGFGETSAAKMAFLASFFYVLGAYTMWLYISWKD